MTVFASVNSGPASESLGFHAVTVPMYTPGAARVAARYTTGMSVSRAPAGTVVGAESHGALLCRRNCAARRPATWRTRNTWSVSPGPAKPSRRNAADPPPEGEGERGDSWVRTRYSDPWCPPSSQRYAASRRGSPAPSSSTVSPPNGVAEARSAWTTSAALTLRPSWSVAERRHAASPAAWGAAMLVPPLISLPVSHRGTAENATPGVTRSGFASSPPRELHQPITSAAGGLPGCAGRANAPGKAAPTDTARSAEPGNPVVERPGP